jgi:O-antigen/teichoic acid export membrane protein
LKTASREQQNTLVHDPLPQSKRRNNLRTGQKILKNFLSLSFAEITSSLLGFFAFIFLARVLGPADFGKINFAIALVLYFTIFSSFGFDLIGSREVARSGENAKKYISNILFIRMLLSVVMFVVLLAFTYMINKPFEIKELIVLYGISVMFTSFSLDWAFQGMERMEFIAAVRIISTALYVVGIIFLIKSPDRLLYIPAIKIAVQLLSSVSYLAIFGFFYGAVWPRLEPDLAKKFIVKTLPVGISLIMIQIYLNIDTVMLGFMRTNEEVGYYSAAYKVLTFLLVMEGTFHNAIYPVLSRFYKESKEKLEKLLSMSAKAMVTVAIPVGVGGMILSDKIIRLFYGANYNASALAFQILVWVAVISYVNTVYTRNLMACDREKKYLLTVSTAAGVNIIMNLLLIPVYGMYGAAIATIAAEIACTIVAFRESWRLVKVPFHGYILKPVIAAAVMGSAIFFLRGWNVIILVALGAIVYAAVFILVGGVKMSELKQLKHSLASADDAVYQPDERTIV